jgi:hypothetical protein
VEVNGYKQIRRIDYDFASGGGVAREWRSNLKPATIEKRH